MKQTSDPNVKLAGLLASSVTQELHHKQIAHEVCNIIFMLYCYVDVGLACGW